MDNSSPKPEHITSDALIEARQKEAAERLEKEIEKPVVFTASVAIKTPIPVTKNG